MGFWVLFGMKGKKGFSKGAHTKGVCDICDYPKTCALHVLIPQLVRPL